MPVSWIQRQVLPLWNLIPNAITCKNEKYLNGLRGKRKCVMCWLHLLSQTIKWWRLKKLPIFYPPTFGKLLHTSFHFLVSGFSLTWLIVFFFVIWCALSNGRFLISFKIRFFCIDKSRKLISQLLIFTITRNIWNLRQCDKISYFFAYQLSMVFLQLRYNLSYSPILVPPAGTW